MERFEVIEKVSKLRGEKLCCYQQAYHLKGARQDELMERAYEILDEIEELLLTNGFDAQGNPLEGGL